MTRRQKTVGKILELKEFTKEQLEAEVRSALQRLRAEEERLVQLDREYQERSEALARKQETGKIAVNELDLYYMYLKHLGKLIERQQGIVAVRMDELGKLQEAMLSAHQEQRLLEKLQDKLLRGQLREEALNAQKQADYHFLSRKGLK